MDKYTKHSFFTAEVRASLYSTPSDAIFITCYRQIFTIFWNSQNPQNLTSKVYFLYAIQHNTELLSKTIKFVK